MTLTMSATEMDDLNVPMRSWRKTIVSRDGSRRRKRIEGAEPASR
jgi:hypothetical protein